MMWLLQKNAQVSKTCGQLMCPCMLLQNSTGTCCRFLPGFGISMSKNKVSALGRCCEVPQAIENSFAVNHHSIPSLFWRGSYCLHCLFKAVFSPFVIINVWNFYPRNVIPPVGNVREVNSIAEGVGWCCLVLWLVIMKTDVSLSIRGFLNSSQEKVIMCFFLKRQHSSTLKLRYVNPEAPALLWNNRVTTKYHLHFSKKIWASSPGPRSNSSSSVHETARSSLWSVTV